MLRLYRLDLHVPFAYWGDALYFEAWAKGLLAGNWPWHNPQLGMPLGADWRDFPVTLAIEAVLVRLFGTFTSSPGLVLNILWLFATTLCAGFATYCFQRLGANKYVAGTLGILYALQPFTFYRGVAHFNLLFYLVPLLATGAIEIAAGRIPCCLNNDTLLDRVRSVPTYLYLACLAQGISYVYNSFFAIILFAVASLSAYLISRRKSALFAGALPTCVIACAALAVLAPTLTYRAKHGANPGMAYKSPAQADVYGLRLRILLTPTPGNPLPPLHYIQNKLDNSGFTGTEDESTDAKLGTIGSVGLLYLLAWTLVSCLRKAPRDNQFSNIVGSCAALVFVCFLLATVGGFGSIFDVFVSPDIRCYNRISVFIEFFSFTAIGLLLTRASAWCLDHHWPRAVGLGGLIGLLVFGVADQAVAVAADYRNDAQREQQFKVDSAFVKLLESELPRNASIFQLPDTNFPADPAPFHMLVNDQGRPYLHSDTLRWSWGGIFGRDAGNWTHEAASLPVKDMLARLSNAGFSGIWIDRFGYAPGTSPERGIANTLDTSAVERPDGRIAFYDLRGYGPKQAGDTRSHEQNIHPIDLTFPVGFYNEERDDRQTWRWSLQDGVIQVHNILSSPQTVKLAMRLQTGSAKPDAIVISGGGRSEKIDVTSSGLPYTRTIHLSPGQSLSLSIHCECNPIRVPPGESRVIYFGVINPKIVE